MPSGAVGTGAQKGKHAFKFIVDDEWRFAPDQPTVADIEGRVNNFIDVSDFVGYTGEENFEANRMKVSARVRGADGGGEEGLPYTFYDACEIVFPVHVEVGRTVVWLCLDIVGVHVSEVV